MTIDLSKEYGITSFKDYRIEVIKPHNIYKICINEKDVFLKSCDDENRLYSELIAMKLLDILNIPRVKGDIGLIKGKMHFLS